MILVAIILLFVVANALQAARKHQMASTIRRGVQRQEEQRRQAALASIQSRDANFDLQAFLNRASVAFEKIQLAWSEQDLTAARPFISDGVFERFRLQIDMMKEAGLRNVMSNVQVLSRQAVALYFTPQFDTVHVRFSASADDRMVDLKTGRALPGSDHSGPFVEYWSFHRRPGVQTLKTGGAIEGNCPRCAAPLKIVDQSTCPACGAKVNSGEYDWVLSEITQESEFQIPGSEQDLPGLAKLSERDPGFSLQHIEDRVSVMFWRLRAAEFYRDFKYAAPVMTPAMGIEFSKTLSQQNRYWKEAAVGQVEVIGTEPGQNGNDLLKVKVRWSGILMNRTAQAATELRGRAINTQIYTLLRHSRAQTNLAGTFQSAGCPSCGAPLEIDGSGNCAYCGTGVTSGEFDWVLASIDRFTGQEADRHFTGLALQREQHAKDPLAVHATDTPLALSILAQAALLDGVLDEQERTVLQKLGARRGLSGEQVDKIIDQARATEARLPEASSPVEARNYVQQLVHVFMADGILSGREEKLLSGYAASMGLSASDVRLAINQERARLYQASRQAT